MATPYSRDGDVRCLADQLAIPTKERAGEIQPVFDIREKAARRSTTPISSQWRQSGWRKALAYSIHAQCLSRFSGGSPTRQIT